MVKNKIKRIISERHLNESNKDFNEFLEGKDIKTQKRYIRFRNNVKFKRSEGYDIHSEKGYIIFKKSSRAGSDLTDYSDIKDIGIKHTYSQLYEFICNTPSLNEKHHRHAYETRSLKPDDRKALISHDRIFTDHVFIEYNYEGTWVIY